jgi:hypothetical protein
MNVFNNNVPENTNEACLTNDPTQNLLEKIWREIDDRENLLLQRFQ